MKIFIFTGLFVFALFYIPVKSLAQDSVRTAVLDDFDPHFQLTAGVVSVYTHWDSEDFSHSNHSYEFLYFLKPPFSFSAFRTFAPNIHEGPTAIFAAPVGVYIPLLDAPIFSKIGFRGMVYAIDASHMKDGIAPKLYEVSLRYDAPLFLSFDLSYRGMLFGADNRYEAYEGVFLSLMVGIQFSNWERDEEVERKVRRSHGR